MANEEVQTIDHIRVDDVDYQLEDLGARAQIATILNLLNSLINVEETGV